MNDSLPSGSRVVEWNMCASSGHQGIIDWNELFDTSGEGGCDEMRGVPLGVCMLKVSASTCG